MGRLILAVIRIIGAGYWLAPRKLSLWIGNRLGDLLRVSGFRSKIAHQNLAFACEAKLLSGERAGEIFRESYRYFGNLILEICLVLGSLDQFVFKYVDMSGHENWKKAHARGKGVLFLSSHVGNWEVMAATGGLIADIDLMLVTKQLKPAWLHAAIEKGRARCKVLATYEPKTARDVLAHLKKNGTVGFVLDQYVGPPVGVRVPLFGRPVGTLLALATFAKRTGATVVPVVNYRKPDGRWAVEIKEPLEWVPHEESHYELAINTAGYAQWVEKDILSHAEQWLWVHRRFKGDLGPLREGEWAAPRVRK